MKRLVLFILISFASLTLHSADFKGAEVEPLKWEQLMPPGFNLQHLFDRHEYVRPKSDLLDSDDEIKLHALRVALGSTPVVKELDGKKVKIPGFVVPLGGEGMTVTEFFLVPFFGACIHVPPPPSNQMVHVTFEQGVNINNLFEAVSVTGTIRIEKVAHELGISGYKMEAINLESYVEE